MVEHVSPPFLPYPLTFLPSECVCAHQTYTTFMLQQMKSHRKENRRKGKKKFASPNLNVCTLPYTVVLSTALCLFSTAVEKRGRTREMSRNVEVAITETKMFYFQVASGSVESFGLIIYKVLLLSVF
jgi:hypothetical protein